MLRSFAPDRDEHPVALDVPDPYYGGETGFADVFDIIDAACTGLLAEIQAEIQAETRPTCWPAATHRAPLDPRTRARFERDVIGSEVAEAIGAALGVGVRSATPVGGGESSDAWRVELDDATLVFAKTNASARPGLFSTEADGLARLEATATVRVPSVLAFRDDADGPTARRPDDPGNARRAGRRALHRPQLDRAGAPRRPPRRRARRASWRTCTAPRLPGSAWTATPSPDAGASPTPGATPGPSSTASTGCAPRCAWPWTPSA